ncbi:MAG: glycosyltransferase family 39 protein [Lentisphaerae bacterium]|nr:glycosyltransferase family 39 protein [Lentisphaerota bacterium]
MSKAEPERGGGAARRLFLLGLLACTLLGGVLRLTRLDAWSVWIDELYTVQSCAEPARTPLSKRLGYVPTALSLRGQGIPPSTIPPERPETWRALGIREDSLRLASCWIGILTIPLLGLASRKPFGDRPALLAALLLAVAPWHIEWSQAARYYTQQFLFYALALTLYYRATRTRRTGWLIAALLALVLAFLTQPPALLLVGVFFADAVAAAWLGRTPPLSRRSALPVAAAALFCAGILFADLWRAPGDWSHLVTTGHQTPLKLLLGIVYLSVPSVVALAALATLWLARKRDGPVVYLALGVIVPLAAFMLLAARHYVALRYALPVLYPLLLLAALGLDRLASVLRPALGFTAAAAPAALLLTPVLFLDYVYFTGAHGFRRRWRDAYAFIDAHRRPGELVCAGPASYTLIARYYLQDAAPVRPLPATRAELDAWGRSAWLVYEAESIVEAGTHEAATADWVPGAAELKAVYNLHVIQPRATVHVYYYEQDPASHD